ncbi:MAG: T9SS type A sorting domain-containing protein [Bacteroidales bacterium]|nr:T9SS type A sorting domain-containing protein [Bacteroidales bacterium]
MKNLFIIVLLGSLPLNLWSQIDHHVINPYQRVGLMSSPKSFNIDFNSDQSSDLLFWTDLYKIGAGCISVQMGRLFSLQPVDTAYFFVDSTGLVATFEMGDTIHADNEHIMIEYFCKNGSIYKCPFIYYAEYENCRWNNVTRQQGYWLEYSDKYMGMKLLIGDQYHYAWVKMTKAHGIDLFLKSYAYNTIPDSTFVITDPMATSADIQQMDEMVFYPNPVEDVLYIDLNGQESTIELYNMSGILIHHANSDSSLVNKISLSNLDKGIYLLRLTLKDRIVTERIVKL